MRRSGSAARCGLATWAASALIFCTGRASAAEFYVDDAAGSDAAVGSAATPWRTLQKAADVVAAGDRVIVRAGTYAGFYLDHKNGSASAPIEFIAAPGAVIDEDNGRTLDGINLEGASYVTIDGFAVTGMGRAGVRSVLGSHVTIRNVHAYNNTRWGIFTGFVDDLLIENNETSGSIIEHGIYVSNSGDRPVLRGNHSWGNHGCGIHMNGDAEQGGDGIITGALVSRNLIHDNAAKVNNGPWGGGSGINMDGVQNSRIENNLLYRNHASGISLYRIDGGGPSSGNVVVNNSVHQPGTVVDSADGRWALNITDGAVNNVVFNNIFVTEHASRGSISASADSLSGLVSDYNVLEPPFSMTGGTATVSLSTWRAGGRDVNSRVADAAALFVNSAAGDYRLKPGATAIDAGVASFGSSPSRPAPTVDLFGTARPQGAGFDAGAIERTSLTGDFNGDSQVNATDLGLWRGGFGTASGAGLGQGNADADQDVDGADYLAWQRQFGAAPGAQAGSITAPEPGGAALALATLLISAANGRKKKKPAP